MAYQLIALDLDDTLLNSEKTISEANKAAVLAAKRAGNHIILASGRAYEGVAPYNEQLNNQDYSIVCGGAQVTDQDGKILYSCYVPPTLAMQVMRWASLRDIYFQLYFDDGYHYLRRTKYTELYEQRCAYIGQESPDLMQIETVLTAKILLIDEPENILRYQSELSAQFPELEFRTSQADYLEVMNPETSKGKALEFIATKLDLEPDQLIAVGDSEIDVSMITYAGLGVAMGNAPDGIKAAADFIAPPCEEDGVAFVISKYMLGE